MRTGATPDGVATEPAEGALLLELAKDSFRQQIARRVRPLARSYVERWLKCELWLYSSVIQRHSNELHSYKAVVLQTLRTTSSRFVERRDLISSTCGPSPRHEPNCRKKSRRRSRPSRPPNVRASRRALGGKAGWAWAHRAPAARSTFLKEPASW